MIAVVSAATLIGTTGRAVWVEVHVSSGIPGFTVVGLPDASVREARDRVRAALLSSGFSWPQRRITVNLAPSGMRKGGAGLDLAIAVGVLVAEGELDAREVEGCGFVGELGLDGSIRSVPGMIALAHAIEAPRVVVPSTGVGEARAARRSGVRGAGSLRELAGALAGTRPWGKAPVCRPAADAPVDLGGWDEEAPPPEPAPADLEEVRGQRLGRRVLEVAAAGGHHLLMVGPPGSGKTMLAERLRGILPPLNRAESLVVSQVHSAAGIALPPGGLYSRPPFRAPHHGASAVSLVGGGTSAMRPGEISLATHGVLFLDELGEFPRTVLDALRQPLEEGLVRVSRARGTATFPARFLLVGAMNPCPCGEGGPPGRCRCTPAERTRSSRRVSGPLLDRFDLVVALERPDPTEYLGAGRGEPSAVVARRVMRARALAGCRGVRCNAALDRSGLERHAPLSSSARALLERRLDAGGLSGRGLERVWRVARTLADLEGHGSSVGEEHVAEALALRAGVGALGGEPAR